MAKLHRDNAGYIGCSHEETQDPYYSYNKLALPLAGADDSIQRPAEVTHTVTVAGGKFVIGGVSQATLSLTEGGVYKFDQSNSSNGTHPFKFSQTSNGTWNRGTEYTKGVTYVGTPGSSGAYTQLVVPFGGLDLFYYCGNHTGMGGSASTPANAGMATVGLPILKTTDQVGKTLGSGTNPDPFAANLVLALPMNGTNGGTTFADQSASIKGSGTAKAVTRNGTPTTTTSISKYYGSSAVFDGTDDYLSLAASSDFDFGSEDFTIEFWWYRTSNARQALYHRSSGTDHSLGIDFASQGQTLGIWASSNGTSWDMLNADAGGNGIGTITPALNAWSHIAFTRSGSEFRLYINGILDISVINSSSIVDETALSPNIGTWWSTSSMGEVTGNLCDFRIYKGIAKYQPEGSGSLGMDAITYVGTGATNTISSLAFKPDLVWIKGMATGSNTIQHVLQDTVRGTSAILSSEQGNKEADYGTHWGYISSFNDDGFTLTAGAGGPDHNNHNGTPYAAWCWKAGGPATSVAAGSLNSSLYNTSSTWSNNWTASGNGFGAQPPTYGFDSNFNNNINNNAGGQIVTWNTTSYTLSGTLEINCYSSSGLYDVYVNGVKASDTPSSRGWINCGSFADINEIQFGGTSYDSSSGLGSAGILIYEIKVAGKTLVDSGISSPSITSLACSVSASDTYGFSITTWTGDGNNNRSVSHGLSKAPSWVIIKNRDATTSWHTFVRALDPNGRYQLYLDGTQGSTDFGTNFFNADSNVINLIGGSSAGINGGGADYVAYSWSEVANFSKFGSYSGAANLKITTGFKPRLVLIKCSSEGGFNWVIVDGARGNQSNGVSNKLYPNSGTDENNDSRGGETKINFLDDGFQFADQGAETNSGSRTYIYAAFAESAPGDPGQDAFRGLETLNTTDQSSSAHTVTNNGASFQTSVKKFYEGSAAFSGGQSIEVVSSDFDFGTADFTMECWVNFASLSANAGILDTRSDANTNGFALLGRSSGVVQMADGTSLIGSSVAVSLNSWVHIAGVRQGSNLSLYYNGSPVGAVTNTTDFSNGRIKVGTIGSNSEHLNGYVQDVRIYKGIAKYTSSFSPPERSLQGTARRYPSGVYVVS